MKLATLGLMIRDGHVLLGEKKDGAEIGAGTLNGPGGKCEDEDQGSLERCLIREIEEEFGVTPTEFSKVAVIRFFAAGVLDFEVHAYLVTAWQGEPQETDAMIPGWYPLDQLPYDRMLESDRHWFAQACSGERFNANVYYRERAKDFIDVSFLAFGD